MTQVCGTYTSKDGDDDDDDDDDDKDPKRISVTYM